MSSELKPCPFCGSSAKFGKVPDTDYRNGTEFQNAGGEYIECTNIACAATTMLIFPTMSDAKPFLIEKWNRRSGGVLDRQKETNIADLETKLAQSQQELAEIRLVHRQLVNGMHGLGEKLIDDTVG